MFKVLKTIILRHKLVSVLLLLLSLLIICNPCEIYRIHSYIDVESLSVIISLLLISKALIISGYTGRILYYLSKVSFKYRILVLTITAYIISVFITNDGAIILFAPLIVSLLELMNIDERFPIILVIVAANMGSIILPIGNPQDIIIYTRVKPSLDKYIINVLPLYITGLLLLIMYYYILVYRTIRTKTWDKYTPPKIRVKHVIGLPTVVFIISLIILMEYGLAYYALPFYMIYYAVIDYELVKSIDYELIILFALFFALSGGIVDTLIMYNIIPVMSDWIQVFIIGIVLSQFISNVPTTIIMINIPGVKDYWIPLLYSVNVGGIGLIQSSLANILAYRLTGITLREYHKYMLMIFPVFLLVSIIIVYIMT